MRLDRVSATSDMSDAASDIYHGWVVGPAADRLYYSPTFAARASVFDLERVDRV